MSNAPSSGNHTYRVANLCLAQANGRADAVEKVAIAVAFHDLGIWTDHTFDYLEPSVRLATAYLANAGHGRVGAGNLGDDPRAPQDHSLPGQSRVACRAVPSGRLDRRDARRDQLRRAAEFRPELYAAWPDAGFHKLLVALEFGHLWKHPLDPLPVFRW